ncbi:MAG: class I SAM-dependent methyltransferase [Streptosporangiaceae bacterium]
MAGGDPAALLDRWRADLASWAIPDEILAAVDESPWTLPTRTFTRRAEEQLREPSGPSFARAYEALVPAGSVLDVGAGGGAASLPLAPRASAITAVDEKPAMLRSLSDAAHAAGTKARVVEGRWPDVAHDVPPADVVTCHHVLYNAPDVGGVVTALADHARRRVVVEVTARHPLTSLNPLWERFHGLVRPRRPTADDAIAIIEALGHRPSVRRWTRGAVRTCDSFAELVEVTRRRVCLPRERGDEVAEALRDLGVDPACPEELGGGRRDLVTIWWEP